MPPEAFGELVSDALSNLYDPVHLRDHPLQRELSIQPAPGESEGEALRRLLRDAIESLAPPAGAPASGHAWLRYRVLVHHYVRCLTPDETCQELSISRASFYRRRREALDALVASLQAQRSRSGSAAFRELPSPEAGSDEKPADRARKLVATMPQTTFDLVRLTQVAERTVMPLAEEHGVAIRTHLPAGLPAAMGIEPLLRQVIVGALAESIDALRDDRLHVWLGQRGPEAWWRFQAVGDPRALTRTGAGISVAFWRCLLRACRGSIWFCYETQALYLALPLFPARPTVLVIDDEPRAVELYRRYLESADYLVVTAHNAAEAQQAIEQAPPHLVLLDIILPEEDGWVVLSDLRSNPETAPIPVIVCSVMGQADLALALGAAAVLSKPITPESLLEAVREQLPSADRPA